MTRPKVSIVRGEDPGENARRAVELLGGIKRFVTRGKRVLIKPNLSFLGSQSTNPGVVRSLAAMALEAGAGEVTIGEGMLGMTGPRPEHFERTGYKKIARELGLKLKNLNEDEAVRVEIPGARVAKKVIVSRSALEADILINVPIMKTHFLASVTLGMKNLKGCLIGHEKGRFHIIGLHRAIADLNLLLKPRLTLIDATVAGEGMGPHWGNDIRLDLVLAGDDPFATDVAGAAVMGYRAEEVDHLRLFARKEGRSLSLRRIELLGEPLGEVRREFKRPPDRLEVPRDVRLVSGEPCSGCIGSLMVSFHLFEKNGDLDILRDYTIVVGHKADLPEDYDKLLIVGNCAARLKHAGLFAAGCPPSAENLPYFKLCADKAMQGVVPESRRRREDEH